MIDSDCFNALTVLGSLLFLETIKYLLAPPAPILMGWPKAHEANGTQKVRRQR